MPLPEVIGASLGISSGGSRAERLYLKLLQELGTEAHILREVSYGDIESVGGDRLADGIRRLREGRVIKSAGYDGEYGKIALFTPGELKNASGQLSFLNEVAAGAAVPLRPSASESAPLSPKEGGEAEPDAIPRQTGCNAAQQAAARSEAPVTAVIAGPGTGKTFTLTERIARLVESGVKPEKICAVTFTVRAAEEMRGRLRARVKHAEKITVGTIHSICYSMLRGEVALAERALQLRLAGETVSSLGLKCSPRQLLRDVSAYKNGNGERTEGVAAYCDRLC